jgi:hypothetical protein
MPQVYAAIAVILIWAASVGGAYFKGVNDTTEKYLNEQKDQALKNADQVAQIIKETEDKTRKLYEDKIKNQKRLASLPDTCQLSADFRRLHDEAAGVQGVPSAQAVAAGTVAATIEKNYSYCRQNAIWLEECNRICSP